MDTRVDGHLVHCDVKLSQDVSEGAVVPEPAPLCVDAHSSVLALDTLHVLHLLHVTGICSSTCRIGEAE